MHAHCKNCHVEYVANVCKSHTVCVSNTVTVCMCIPQCVCDVHTFAIYSTWQFLQCGARVLNQGGVGDNVSDVYLIPRVSFHKLTALTQEPYSILMYCNTEVSY